MKKIKGKIIKNISNTYIVKSEDKEYEMTARGKLKTMEIKPVVGDNVEFEVVDENNYVITKILDRKNYLKRPKVSNISQVIFVISPKMPTPNFLMLDKQIALAEFLGLNSVIVINKIDLDEEKADEIARIYEKTGYKVIKTNAEEGIGVNEIKKILKDNTSVLAGQSGVRKVNYHKQNNWRKTCKNWRNK